mgnify:CR=1 FL=1
MRLMSADVSNLPLGSRVVVRWRLAVPDPATGQPALSHLDEANLRGHEVSFIRGGFRSARV